MRQGTRGTSSRRTVLFVVTVLMVWVQLLSVSAASGAPLGFGAAPAQGSPGAERGYFRFDTDPGATSRQVLVVTNVTDAEKTIRVAACDGRSAVFGGVDYTGNDEPTKNVGSWITFGKTTVRLPAHSRVSIPFEVRVPGDAASGVHVGGVSIWEPAAATSSSPRAGASVGTEITTVTRMVITVWVNTPGPAVPAIQVRGVSAEARPAGMYLVMALVSDGTAPASGEGIVTLEGRDISRPFSFGMMVPGSSTKLPVKWMVDPEAGTYQARVEVRYDKGTRVARWSGPITVGAAAKAQLADRVPGLSTARADRALLLYSIGGAVLLVAVLAGFGIGAKRRRDPLRAET